MKRKTILAIAVITSLSLTGMLITQAYWVSTAYKLKEDQLNNSIRIALKSTINQLNQAKNDAISQKTDLELASTNNSIAIADYISKQLLDSLLSNEITCMDLKNNYYYGIYNKNDHNFIIGKYKNHEEKLLDSQYQFSLSSLCFPDDYVLAYYLPDMAHILYHRMELWVFLSILFLIILIISFVFVIFTILHQKKVSEVKTNFINNMTHEFKTPIATSSLAAEMILKPKVINDPKKIKKYSTVILDENKKLQNQIEQVLQVAILESGNQHFKIRKTNVHDIIKAVVNSLELRIKEENVKITLNTNAQQPVIMGDKIHLVNTFFNLIDNAIKYSEGAPEISISTKNNNDYLIITVTDCGIGIDKEYQPYVFNNLYRVPTGNLHDVRGFGLGLFYVKTVVDELWGKIEIKSEPKKGSTFTVYFPTINKKNNYAN